MNGDFTIESGEEAADKLLARRDPPTAVFCFNDQMAIGVMNVARRRSLRLPEDLSVIGFDDISFARYTVPPLTTVAQPVREMGHGDCAAAARHHQRTHRRPVSMALPRTAS